MAVTKHYVVLSHRHECVPARIEQVVEMLVEQGVEMPVLSIRRNRGSACFRTRVLGGAQQTGHYRPIANISYL